MRLREKDHAAALVRVVVLEAEIVRKKEGYESLARAFVGAIDGMGKPKKQEGSDKKM